MLKGIWCAPCAHARHVAGSYVMKEYAAEVMAAGEAEVETYRKYCEWLLQHLEQRGYSGACDFLYVPLHYTTRRAFGFEVVNFVSPEIAIRFHKAVHGSEGNDVQVFWPHGEERQGLSGNVDRLRNSRVMHSIVPDEF